MKACLKKVTFELSSEARITRRGEGENSRQRILRMQRSCVRKEHSQSRN